MKITPNTKIRKPATCASSSICRDVVVFHCSADPGRCTPMQNVTRNGFPRTLLLWFRTFLYVWSLLPKTDAQMTGISERLPQRKSTNNKRSETAKVKHAFNITCAQQAIISSNPANPNEPTLQPGTQLTHTPSFGQK